MSLSTQFLAVALIIAAIATIVAQSHDRLPSFGAIARAAVVVFWLTIAALAVHALTGDLNIFGVAHILYLALVVTVPVTSFTLLLIGVTRLRGTNRRLAGRNVAALLVGIVPAALGYYATHIEPNRLVVDKQTIALPEVGTIAQPVRIAVLSDVQSPNIGAHERNAFAQIVEADADLVLIPGDLWSGGARGYPRVENELIDLVGQLTAGHHHVVMVAGDTDSPQQLRELAAATGAIFLDDEVWRHDIGGQPVVIAGTSLPAGDASAIDDQLQLEIGLIEPDELAIMVSHRPDAALGLGEAASIDLVVAGHTHGGQVALPFFGPLVTLTNVPRAAARGGAIVVDGRALYVSAGVGMERGQAPQLRFGVPPEIGILEVVKSTE